MSSSSALWGKKPTPTNRSATPRIGINGNSWGNFKRNSLFGLDAARDARQWLITATPPTSTPHRSNISHFSNGHNHAAGDPSSSRRAKLSSVNSAQFAQTAEMQLQKHPTPSQMIHLSLQNFQQLIKSIPAMESFPRSGSFKVHQECIRKEEEKEAALREATYQISQEVKNAMALQQQRQQQQTIAASAPKTIAEIFPPRAEDDPMDVDFDLDDSQQQPQQQQQQQQTPEQIEEARVQRMLELRRQVLPEEELQHIKHVLSLPESKEVVIDKFNIDMTVTKIRCLRPGAWLNDEVINFYMSMLIERDQRMRKEENERGINSRTSYFFNSFFLDRLVDHGVYTYKNVKRWSKKFDVFEKEKIVFPVNLHNTHWTLAVAFIQKKEIVYYDSMNGTRRVYLQAILRWLQDEAREKKNIELDTSDWKLIDQLPSVPQQRNGFDCGLFSIMCADAIADNLPFTYSQKDMPMNRYKVGAAILRGSINY